jgi:hypothetical protein
VNIRWIPAALAAALSAGAQSPAPAPATAFGPEPTPAEATQFVKLWAEKAAKGPRTPFAKVKVVGPARWHAVLTARWPKGKDGEILEGWLISFEEKPNWGLNPYGRPRTVELLVDRDRVVHWRTQTEWDARNREVRP